MAVQLVSALSQALAVPTFLISRGGRNGRFLPTLAPEMGLTDAALLLVFRVEGSVALLLLRAACRRGEGVDPRLLGPLVPLLLDVLLCAEPVSNGLGLRLFLDP